MESVIESSRECSGNWLSHSFLPVAFSCSPNEWHAKKCVLSIVLYLDFGMLVSLYFGLNRHSLFFNRHSLNGKSQFIYHLKSTRPTFQRFCSLWLVSLWQTRFPRQEWNSLTDGISVPLVVRAKQVEPGGASEIALIIHGCLKPINEACSWGSSVL